MVRWALPLIVLAFYAVTAAGSGVFRDELYYFACARHLDWGYVDHPPMIAVLAALVRVVFGRISQRGSWRRCSARPRPSTSRCSPSSR